MIRAATSAWSNIASFRNAHRASTQAFLRYSPVISSTVSPCTAASLSTLSVSSADDLPDFRFCATHTQSCYADSLRRKPLSWDVEGAQHQRPSTAPSNITSQLSPLALLSPVQRWLRMQASSVALLPIDASSKPLMLMPRHKGHHREAAEHHHDQQQPSPKAAAPQAGRAPASSPSSAAGQAAGSSRLPPLQQRTYPLQQAEFHMPRKPPTDKVQVHESPDSLHITIQPQGPTFPTLMTSSMALAFSGITLTVLLNAIINMHLLLLLFTIPFVLASVRLAGQAVAGWCLREVVQLRPEGYFIKKELLGLGQSSEVMGPLRELAQAQAQVEVAPMRQGVARQAQSAGVHLYGPPASHAYLGSLLPSSEEQMWLAAAINRKLAQLKGTEAQEAGPAESQHPT